MLAPKGVEECSQGCNPAQRDGTPGRRTRENPIRPGGAAERRTAPLHPLTDRYIHPRPQNANVPVLRYDSASSLRAGVALVFSKPHSEQRAFVPPRKS